MTVVTKGAVSTAEIVGDTQKATSLHRSAGVVTHDFNGGGAGSANSAMVRGEVRTLASFPGPGYTRLLEYDEEGRLVRIRRDYGNDSVQLAYEYAYGFDGGRRWRKDYLNGVWTRYPCGVACGAGELVEQQKPLEGGTWTTTALYLQGISLVRRNGEWHHFDPLGTAGVITNSSASVISNNLYDVFGVLRYEQGSAQTPWRLVEKRGDDENTLSRTAKISCTFGGAYLDNIVPRAAVSTFGIRLLGTAIHGNWCGPGHPGAGCRGPKLPPHCRPIDELDSCCMAHDTCYDQNRCGAAGIVLNPTCWYCDCILWNCARKADCTKSPDPKSCERARRLILAGIGSVRPWWCIITADISRY